MEFPGLLKDAVREAEIRNDKAVIALLDVVNLKNGKNRQADITTALGAVKEGNAYLLQDSKTPYVVPRMEGSNQNTAD